VLAVHGLEELGHKLNAMTRHRKWGELAAEVPDDFVHLFAGVGRYDQIANAITERFGGLADALNARAAPSCRVICREILSGTFAVPRTPSNKRRLSDTSAVRPAGSSTVRWLKLLILLTVSSGPTLSQNCNLNELT
jgi:hypothetical protein